MTDQYTDKDVRGLGPLQTHGHDEESYNKISGSVKAVDEPNMGGRGFKDRPATSAHAGVSEHTSQGELWGHFVLYRYEDVVSPPFIRWPNLPPVYAELVAAMKHKTGTSFLEIA